METPPLPQIHNSSHHAFGENKEQLISTSTLFTLSIAELLKLVCVCVCVCVYPHITGDLAKLADFDSVSLGWGPRFCITSKYPDSGVKNTFCVSRGQAREP